MISIIVVNYNGGEKVLKAVKSILNQNFSDYEIIVVDNGSTDGSIGNISKLNSSKLHIVPLSKNYGFTGGCNRGINISQGEYILLLNNDAYLADKEFLSHAVQALKKTSPNVCCILPKVIFNWEPHVVNGTFSSWTSKGMWHDKEIGSIDPEVFGIKEKSRESFGAMFIAPIFKKEIIKKVRLFDETFFTYGEDFDMSYRLNIYGYKFVYFPDLKVLHDFRSSSNEKVDPLWSYFYFLRNYLLVILKNYEFCNLITKLPVYTAYMRHAIRTLIKTRNAKLFSVLLRVFISLLILMPKIIKNRILIQRERKLKDQDIWSEDFAVDFGTPFYCNSNIVLNLVNIRN